MYPNPRKRAPFLDGPRGTERELAKLRRDQDIVARQLQVARDPEKVALLQERERDLQRRVDELVFGDEQAPNGRQKQIWKYNRITGIWVPQRAVTDETSEKWLTIYRRDEPQEHFTVSRNKPSGKPWSFERHEPNHAAVHYVWLVDSRGVPLDTEGPYGPMSLTRAEQFARIGATKGGHDRVVSIGKDIMSGGFEIVRRYRRGTGERVQ